VTPRPVSEAQIAAYVRELQGRAGGRVIALRATPEWKGSSVIRVDGRSVRVVPCASSLAVRQALAQSHSASDTLVVLTDRPEQDLGDDVVSRLSKQRVVVPNIWDVLAGAFGASTIDRRIVSHPWLADALLELTSGQDRPVVPGRALSLELAIDTLLGRLSVPTPVTSESLLAWSTDPAGLQDYIAAAEHVQRGIERLLAEEYGTLPAHVLRMVREGAADDVVPVGLVCRLLFPDVPSAESGRAIGRMEQGQLGGEPLRPGLAEEWAAASEMVVRRLLAKGAAAADVVLDRADQLASALEISGLAEVSEVLPAGLERRLEVFADALSDPPRREQAMARVEQHVLASHGARRRVDAARMALRLARLPHPEGFGDSASFSDACHWYQDEGGWMDRARTTLWDQDPNPRVAAVYADLTRTFDEARNAINLRFAQRLRDWASASSTDDGVVPIETIIERVVGPLAAAGPVLMLVMDGMSMAVFRELARALPREGFREITPEGCATRLPAVAVIPSVTEVCRASLLSGYLTGGNQGRERRRFEAHPALVGASTPGAPPRMLHKADLVKDDGRSLAVGVEDLITNPRQRVLGAVLNVIDDQLTKGDQLALEYTPGTIPLLHRLLIAARQAGRVLVLVSDHGHVFERGLEYRKPHRDSGERWRAGDDPSEDEVLLRGDRVLLGDGEVIAAATEWVRYAPKRNGYHGGATPQEMVVPLSVWASSRQDVRGWVDLVEAPPSWWDPPSVTPPPPPVQAPVSARARQPAGQASLFEQMEQPDAQGQEGASWIDRLLASEVLAAQLTHAGRIRLDPQTLRPLLATLDARGGRAPLDVVGVAVGVPAIRAPGLVSQAQRVLNVDGYGILTLDAATDEVVLNRDQLLEQFGL